MADKKISALTGATTPLAGTEVLPIVQGGATVKVAVSDLTAGRVVSATQLTSTVAIGTAPLVVTSTTNVANLNASSLNGATFAAPGAIGGGTASAITGTTIAGTDSTDASSITVAALKTAGGLAVVKKIYVGDNIVVASGKGIDFAATSNGSGTMTSELFADYEEGTWVPDQGSLVVVGAFTSSGAYTKFGRMVTVWGKLAGATSVAVGTGTAMTNNLPFATTSTATGAGVSSNISANITATNLVGSSSTTLYSNTAIAATSYIEFTTTYFT